MQPDRPECQSVGSAPALVTGPLVITGHTLLTHTRPQQVGTVEGEEENPLEIALRLRKVLGRRAPVARLVLHVTPYAIAFCANLPPSIMNEPTFEGGRNTTSAQSRAVMIRAMTSPTLAA